jgi:hypothetical protein
MEKNCTKCNIIKNIDNFYMCSKCKDGYRNECNECRNEYLLQWRRKNPNHNKEWSEKNKEVDRLRKQTHYELNRDKHIQRSKDYRKKNVDKVNLWVKLYRGRRMKDDNVFKMSFIVRGRIRNFIKLSGGIKKDTTFNLIGCSPQELVRHLEHQFIDGMSWENHGEWHIDHIIPLSSAKTEDDLKKLCHHTNLQPLWAEDNLKKSNKILWIEKNCTKVY